jgi:hypothetical protein
MVRIKDISIRVSKDMQFNKWKVLGKPFSIGDGNFFYVVAQCSCGRVSVVKCASLSDRLTPTKSCNTCSNKHSKHGDAHPGNRLYNIWAKVLERCYNPKRKAYKNYGGRGIKVCKAWRTDYRAFKKWALSNGYSDELELDRKNNNGHYSPKNCRWVTTKENSRNKRTNRLITCFGETKCLTAWGEDPRCLVSWSTLQKRLDVGWSVIEAITSPKRR